MEKSGTFGKYWFTNSSNSDNVLTTFLTDFKNFGLILGAGVSYDINKFSISLGVRYNHYLYYPGITSKFDRIYGYNYIPSTEKFHYTDDINLLSIKNLQISLGLLYNLRYTVF
jgi:hypothetical protein